MKICLYCKETFKDESQYNNKKYCSEACSLSKKNFHQSRSLVKLAYNIADAYTCKNKLELICLLKDLVKLVTKIRSK
jgi:hypothetical protein